MAFVGFSTLDKAAETLQRMKATGAGCGGNMWGHRIRTDWSKDSAGRKDLVSTSSKAHPPPRPSWPVGLPKPPPAPKNPGGAASSSWESATSAVEKGLQSLQRMVKQPVKEEEEEEEFEEVIEDVLEKEATDFLEEKESEAGNQSEAETVPFWPEEPGEAEVEEGRMEEEEGEGNRTESSEETKSNDSWASSHPTLVQE